MCVLLCDNLLYFSTLLSAVASVAATVTIMLRVGYVIYAHIKVKFFFIVFHFQILRLCVLLLFVSYYVHILAHY